MAQDFLPLINVIASPTKISKGQMISISVNIVEKTTLQPMVFDVIYMEILDSKGVAVWPLSTIEENSATMSKLISTADMDKGIYTIRITPSKNRRPLGISTFEVENTDMTLIPLIPLVLLSVPSSTKKEKIEKEFVEPPEPPKISWIIYRTEKDTRVCPVCLPDEAKIFRPDDPQFPRIPRHPNCRCVYDIISAEQERKRLNAQIELKAESAMKAAQIFHVYRAAKKYWKSLKIT